MNGVLSTRAPLRPLSPLVLASLAATWLIWGSTYLVIRFALIGFAPFFLMATRFLCAGAILMTWQLARGASLPSVRQWRNALVIGALMLGGGMGGTAYAEQTIASGLVVAFIAVTPLLLIVINLAFGVQPRRSELVAVSVGLVGVLLLTQGAGIRSSPAGLRDFSRLRGLVARQRAESAGLHAGAGCHRVCERDALWRRRVAAAVRVAW